MQKIQSNRNRREKRIENSFCASYQSSKYNRRHFFSILFSCHFRLDVITFNVINDANRNIIVAANKVKTNEYNCYFVQTEMKLMSVMRSLVPEKRVACEHWRIAKKQRKCWDELKWLFLFIILLELCAMKKVRRTTWRIASGIFINAFVNTQWTKSRHKYTCVWHRTIIISELTYLLWSIQTIVRRPVDGQMHWFE